MKPEHLVDKTIATIRASTIAGLRTMVQGHPQETMTSEEVINIVDWVLQEVSDALKDALGNGYLDEQPEQDSWWDGYGSEGFVEPFRGGMVGDSLLPRY